MATISAPASYNPPSDFKLVKTDRNGTRHYESHKCPKCSGKGYIPYYDYVEGGVCFDCGGSGIRKQTLVVRTEEYQAKLDARNLAKALKNAEADNSALFESNGLASDGSAYVVLGNTYPIKDELREEGARFNNALGWYFSHPDTKHECCKVAAHNFMVYNEETHHYAVMNRYEAKDNVQKVLKAYYEEHAQGGFVGNVGERLTLNLRFVKVGSFTTHYSYYGETNYVYTMEDEQGHVFCWKTNKDVEVEDENGEWGLPQGFVKVTGTVKEHKQYKGQNQTALTRCKITL